MVWILNSHELLVDIVGRETPLETNKDTMITGFKTYILDSLD